jgi:hypothetical protein
MKCFETIGDSAPLLAFPSDFILLLLNAKQQCFSTLLFCHILQFDEHGFGITCRTVAVDLRYLIVYTTLPLRIPWLYAKVLYLCSSDGDQVPKTDFWSYVGSY